MNMEQNTKHAARKSQIDRQVEREAYTHNTNRSRIHLIQKYTRTYTQVHAHTYTCTYIHICIYTHIYMYTDIYTCVYICTHMHIHTHTRTCIHTHEWSTEGLQHLLGAIKRAFSAIQFRSFCLGICDFFPKYSGTQIIARDSHSNRLTSEDTEYNLLCIKFPPPISSPLHSTLRYYGVTMEAEVKFIQK